MIFQLLNIPDKIKLERVCSQWRILLKRSWTRFSCLDLSVQKWSTKQPMYYAPNANAEILFWGPLDALKIYSVINRSYLYLTNVDLTNDRIVNKVLSHYKFECAGVCVLDMISSNCLSLKVLSVKVCCTNGLKSIADHIRTLESVYFIGLQNFDSTKVDELLNKIICYNCNMMSISLNKIKSIKFLENVERKWQEIDFICVMGILDNYDTILVDIIRNSKKLLKKLSIKTSKLNFDEIFEALQFCCNLTEINIDVKKLVNTNIAMCLQKILSQCKNIECLTVNTLNCELNVTAKCNLMHWMHHFDPSNLRKLDLSGCIIKLDEFPSFVNLQDLRLYGVISDNDKKICDSIASCLNLEKLQLIKCDLSLKTSCDNYIVKNLSKLKYLVLDDNKNSDLDEKNLIKYASMCLNNLEELHLGLRNLTDNGLKYLPKLIQLCNLSICNGERFTGNSIYRIKTLEKFECFNCKNLKDEFVNLLVHELYNLKELIVYYCPSVTRNIIDYAIKLKSLPIPNKVLLTISACIYKTKESDYNREYEGLRLSILDYDVTVDLSPF